MSRTSTLQHVADQAGVTPMTVSRVLNGDYAPKRADARERAQRIQQIARDLGYRANTAAQATRSGRFGCACLVSSTHGHRSTLFHGLLTGAHDALADHGMHLTFAHCDDEKLTDEQFMPRALREWTADGLLLNYTQQIPGALTRLIDKQRIPSIWLNADQDADCISFDDFAAGRDLCERLLQLGHRRIAFVHYGKAIHYSTAARRDGYAAAMTDAGHQPRFIQNTFDKPELDSLGEPTLPLTMPWLDAEDRPTAVITYSHTEVSAILLAATRLGLSVPADLSVATFADSINDGMGQQVTRMWTFHAQLAKQGVAMLMDKIDAPARRLEPRTVPLEYWPGATIAPPPENS
jgi:LacI family transcriptional regulator